LKKMREAYTNSIIKLTGDWQLYEEGLDRWNICLDFPKEALDGTESGLRLIIPGDVWEILRRGGHSSARYYRMTPEQLRKLAEIWVDYRLNRYANAVDDSEMAEVYLQGCLVANLEDPRAKQVDDFIQAYTPPHNMAIEESDLNEPEEDPDFYYLLYPKIDIKGEGITDMERGSFCYFCGTQLVRVAEGPDGSCYECFKCPPVTHWRWNEDTEFLQLYVAGERCPYCGQQMPQSRQEEHPQPRGYDLKPQRSKRDKKGGKPVTVDGAWWASVVEWCRANNGHDTRNHHNCSKELARMQAKGEAVVVWHDRDHIPGSRDLIASGQT
jgi:hypothetical protein